MAHKSQSVLLEGVNFLFIIIVIVIIAYFAKGISDQKLWHGYWLTVNSKMQYR